MYMSNIYCTIYGTYILGMVLYLREVSEYVALVCVLREEHFARRSLVDYNIDCLKKSLLQVAQVYTYDKQRQAA